MTKSPPSAEHFDDWYTKLNESDKVEQIAIDNLGLPQGFESSSLLSWDGIAVLADALRVGPADVLVDLACGRGSYGIEIARRTGAQLVGVDFSAVAIERARLKSATAQFVVGELAATGLDAESASAVLCIDAMQFADPYEAGLRECLRILRPGGRLVLTGWQAHDLADEQVPARMRYDMAAEFASAGFVDARVQDRPDWRAAELAYWRAATQLDPEGDPGAASLRGEGEGLLPMLERTSRVLATARKPEDGA